MGIKMGNLKKKIKIIISKTGSKIPFRTMMKESEARHILQEWSLCPNGSCITKNRIDLQYDLQVVIPAYNVQDFIKDCLDSVISQVTQYRYLVTVVNDGSQDAASKILSQYDKKTDEFLNGGDTVEVYARELWPVRCP